MTQRPVRAGPWRNRIAFGFVLVALTGCADSCGPNRVNTDDAVLIELPDAHHADVTITSNSKWFRRAIKPRGAPPGATTTTVTLPQDPETLRKLMEKSWEDDLRPVTDDVTRPRATVRAVARLLGSDARIDSLTAGPQEIVGRVTIPSGLADRLTIRPAEVAAAFPPENSVWVGICRKWGEGRWTRSDDAYDRGPGCAGWVPADQAVSVGTMTTSGAHSPLQIPTIWLGVATVALLAVTIAGVAIRRRWWHSLIAVLVVAVTVFVAGQLISVQYTTSDIADTFGTALDAGLHDDVSRLLGWAAVVVFGGIAAAAWLALPEVQRRRERRHQMYAVEPFDAGIRG